MFDLIKKSLGLGPAPDLSTLVKQGAQIIDVRSRDEFRGGHVPGSMNIPLQNMESHLSEIRKDRPVITCCASGMRSASAKRMLQNAGFTEVHNGGGWQSLKGRL